MTSNNRITHSGINKIDDYVERFSLKMLIPENERQNFKLELKSNVIFSVEKLLSEGVDEELALKTTFDNFGNTDYIENSTNNDISNVKQMNSSAKLIGKLISITLCILLIGMLIQKNRYMPIVAIITIVFCALFMYKDKKIKF
ncbi:hypothetical protein D4Z93_10085 [Clostridium fermenticellae]|uniref:Uncharacterized protein n=1 Tax=Clostridium fermenticellae TaxID=2068654 RepID=A0A386H5N5_9CLOT|nr:hypothetical protein [Clostridium fermenticellae]AYD40853.1 hypothetical protein D4Z93_10085 [Clostridium fermenticellae]